jgi:hypothetical protein
VREKLVYLVYAAAKARVPGYVGREVCWAVGNRIRPRVLAGLEQLTSGGES